MRPGTAAEENTWLAVIDAAADAAEAARVVRLSAADGNVPDGDAAGALLQSGEGTCAVLFSGAAPGSTSAGRLRYRLPAGATSHLVADLEPDATYTVTTTVEPAGVVIAIAPGPGPQASWAGVLSFETP